MKAPIFSSTLYSDVARFAAAGLAAGVVAAVIMAASVLALAAAQSTQAAPDILATQACAEPGACTR